MQYEQYREKMNRVATGLGKIYARRIPILIALAVSILAIAAMVMTKGLVVAENDCPTEVIYGEKLGYRVFVLWGRTTYEYREQGSDEWSTEKPIFPGDYQVRAMGKTSFGKKNYTDVHDFTVLPRTITPTVADRSIEYGEKPGIKVDLAKGDRITYTVKYDHMSVSTRAWIDRFSISITDKKGNDRMAGYVIEDTPKTSLTVKPRSLQVTVQDASKVYDDIALTYDGYEISKGTLLEGDRLIAVFRDSQTTAGTRTNVPELRVMSGNTDVTGFYSINVRSGKLTVEQRPLMIRTGSAAFTYSGIPMSHHDYTVDPSTSLVGGHNLTVLGGATILDCGTAENLLNFAVLNRWGADVTANYSIFVEAGTLSMTPREVTVHTESATLTYDGTDQSYPHVTVENGVGDQVRAVNASTIRDVGSVVNRMTVSFFRGDKDVSSNYIIKGYTYGTVTVEPRPITVKIADTTKIYDTTALTSDAVHVYDMGLAKGHILSLKTSGSVVFGTVTNYYVKDSLVIYDENRRDVTHNYTASVLDGTLTVKPRPVTISTGDASKLYDGKPLTQNTATYDPEALLPGHVLQYRVIGTRTDAGTSDNVVDRGSVSVTDAATGEDVSQYYEFIFDEGTLEVLPIPITVETRSGKWVYDGKVHYGSSDVTLTEGQLLKGHYLFWNTDALSVRDAGSIKNAVYVKIRTANGTDMIHNYDITYDFGTLTVTPRPVTVRFPDTELVYDGKPHRVDTCVVDDSSDYGFVLRHRPVVQAKNSGSFTDAGVYPMIRWKVDVYDPSEGRYVTDNYDLTVLDGSLTIWKRPLTIRLDGSKVYDGKPLTEWHVTYLDATSPADGHTLWAQPMETPTDAVRMVSVIDPDIAITDMNGRDVLSNYSVMGMQGTFIVYRRDIVVRSADADKVYDGMPLTAPFGTVSKDSAQLVAGHELLLDVFGTGTEIGQYSNEYIQESLVIWDENESRDVTHNYRVVRWEEGVLTVKYDVTAVITTGSAVKQYDGKPLTCDEYTVEIVHGTLPEGFAIHVDVIGRITRIGYTENLANVIVTDGAGNDVTDLITLDVRCGVLTVLENTPEDLPAEKPTLLLIPAFCHKIYDGTYLYASNALVLTPALAALLEQGYTYEARVAGIQREIGDGVSRVAAFTLYDPDGNDVTDDYEIVRMDGVIRVTAPAVEVLIYPVDKIYNGAPAVWGDEDYEILSLPEGLTLELDVRILMDIGILTLSDLNQNASRYVTYRVLKDGRDVTAQYPLVFKLPEGLEELPVLTVKPRALELTAASEARVDDGNPLSNPAVYISKGSLATGHTLEAVAEGTLQGTGTVINRVVSERVVIRDASGRDVTRNYSLSYIDGSLTLIPAQED
jgi:hypothetical protein